MNPLTSPIDLAAVRAKANSLLSPTTIVDLRAHDYDQSLELFFAPATPPAWTPSGEQLRALCALGFTTVYCNFADDTEFVGAWRMRIVDGIKVPNGDYWVMSERRDKVGYPRYNQR